MVGLVAAGVAAGGPDALAVARVLVGAAFLGAITDAMLLGHWYLVQPGLPRGPLHELLRSRRSLWPSRWSCCCGPSGMVSVLNGTIDDGYGGMLGWFWVLARSPRSACSSSPGWRCGSAQYSAVMAATGLLYLAILTAFGTDLVARALLAS